MGFGIGNSNISSITRLIRTSKPLDVSTDYSETAFLTTAGASLGLTLRVPPAGKNVYIYRVTASCRNATTNVPGPGSAQIFFNGTQIWEAAFTGFVDCDFPNPLTVLGDGAKQLSIQVSNYVGGNAQLSVYGEYYVGL